MTREEANWYIDSLKLTIKQNCLDEKYIEAIEALKAEPCDAVSREAALNKMQYYYDDCAKTSEYTRLGFETAMEVVRALPSVTPAIPACEDAVSRQAVLDYIRDNYRGWFINDDAFMQCVNGIKDFISVTPKQKVVRCKDCKHRDPETKKCDCGCWHFPFVTEDDDFCSYGETKMEGESE